MVSSARRGRTSRILVLLGTTLESATCETIARSEISYVPAAPGSAQNRWVMPDDPGGVPRVSNVRKWRNAQESVTSGTSNWNRAAPSRPRRKRWRRLACAPARRGRTCPSPFARRLWRSPTLSARKRSGHALPPCGKPAGASLPNWQRWDIVAWNDATTDLFGDFGQLETENRNILHWMFTERSARSLFGETWAGEATRMVSLFRAAHDLWPGDSAFAALANRLRATLQSSPASGRRTASAHQFRKPFLRHLILGAVRYDYASFQANDDPALKLALYMRR